MNRNKRRRIGVSRRKQGYNSNKNTVIINGSVWVYITGRRKKKIGTTVKRDGRIRSAPVGGVRNEKKEKKKRNNNTKKKYG